MGVERTYINELFGGGDNFVQGVGLAYGNNDTPLQTEVQLTDGFHSANANFQDDPNPPNTPQNRPDWGSAARVQYKFFGDWKDY